ncbi:hypothetical protein ACMD2_22447, partial [Ananas comosus]
EEILWKTRAKQLWLKEGHCNTKFFHAVVNGRKRSNAIEFIEDETGRKIFNKIQKRSYFFHSFKRLYGWDEEGGRLILVNSVLSNLPLFYFSIFKAPQWVIHLIEALRRSFFLK